jgi:hypothetical protein
MVSVRFNGIDMTLLNIYAPTRDKTIDQTDFYNKLMKEISNISNRIIWTGDFNLHLNPALDQFRTGNLKRNNNADLINSYMQENNLSDIWRIRNPTARRFTWRRSMTNNLQQTRLDYFIISDAFCFDVLDCQIHMSYKSDHNIISLKLQTNTQPGNSRGTWKFNNSLLSDGDYTSKVNPLLREWTDKYNYVKDLGLRWDMVKTEIRNFTIGFCSYKNKAKKALEQELITEIKDLETKMCEKPSDAIKQQLQMATNVISEFDKERLRGAQLRAKCLDIRTNTAQSTSLTKRKPNPKQKP